MPININNEEERQQEIDNHLRLSSNLELRLTKKLVPVLRNVANEAAAVYEQTRSLSSASYVIAPHFVTIENLLKEHYKLTIDLVSKKIFNAVNKKLYIPGYETKDTTSLFERVRDTWITNNALEQSVTISKTSQKDIIDVILQGEQEGLSNSAIASLIRQKLGKQIAPSRALTIAVTETHNASTFANFESTNLLNDDLNLGLQKEWLAVEDSRTRPDHATVDGTIIEMKELFTVGSTKMLRPGDPRGGASQVINCRCTLGYVTN